jgi:hypothetical protein
VNRTILALAIADALYARPLSPIEIALHLGWFE